MSGAKLITENPNETNIALPNQVPDSKSETSNPLVKNTKEEVKPSADESSILDQMEEGLKKMIIGLLKYVFIVSPPKLFRLLSATFPWLVKLIKITFLLFIFLILLLWPLLPLWILNENYIACCISNETVMLLSELQPFIFIGENQKIWFSISATWVTLALMGSIWGVAKVSTKKLKIRRLRKNNSAIESGVSSNAENNQA